MKILIVDDNKLTLKAIEHNLNVEGYETLIAEDGFRAIEILQKDLQHPALLRVFL